MTWGSRDSKLWRRAENPFGKTDVDPLAANLVLLAALLHAGWNTLIKINGDRLAVMGMMAACGAGIALLALPWAPLPALEVWPYIIASVILHHGYRLSLICAYRDGDLSQVYPIARGTAPILVLVFAFVFTGETVSPLAAFAVVLGSLAIVSLALHRAAVVPKGRPVFWALCTATFIACYTVVDGTGVRLTETALSYTAWFSLSSGTSFAVGVLVVRGAGMARVMRRHAAVGFCGAAMSMAAYWLVLWAMTRAPMGPVAAMRETSVIIAALIGVFLLKESFGHWRIAAAIVVAGAGGLLRL